MKLYPGETYVVRSREYRQRIEDEARRFTRRAYLERNQGRLFDVGDLELWKDGVFEAVVDQFWGKPVGVITFDADPVGVLKGAGPGIFGLEIAVTHFDAVGCSTHCSVGGVAFICELPKRPYQWIADDMYKEEDFGCDYDEYE